MLNSPEDRPEDLPPNAGGPINEVNCNDVLCGRGGRIAQHSGNMYFRELVHKYRSTYLSKDTKKLNKVKIASLIVTTIRNLDPPGRFLKEESKVQDGDGTTANQHEEGSNFSGTWYEIGDEKARKKAGQAMREKIIDEGKKQRKEEYPNEHATHSSFSPHHQYLNLQEPSTLPPVPYLQNGYFQQSIKTTMNSSAPSTPASYFCADTMSTDQSFRINQSVKTTSCSFNEGYHESIDNHQRSEPNNCYLREEEEINAAPDISSWNDSWDQGQSMSDFPFVNTSNRKSGLTRTESARRRQFHMMKHESSLPSLKVPSVMPLSYDEEKKRYDDFNENDLMKGSLVSMDMQSSSGSSGDVANNKSLNFDIQSSGELKQKSCNITETSISMNDIKMDSLMASITSLVMSAD